MRTLTTLTTAFAIISCCTQTWNTAASAHTLCFQPTESIDLIKFRKEAEDAALIDNQNWNKLVRPQDVQEAVDAAYKKISLKTLGENWQNFRQQGTTGYTIMHINIPSLFRNGKIAIEIGAGYGQLAHCIAEESSVSYISEKRKFIYCLNGESLLPYPGQSSTFQCDADKEFIYRYSITEKDFPQGFVPDLYIRKGCEIHNIRGCKIENMDEDPRLFMPSMRLTAPDPIWKSPRGHTDLIVSRLTFCHLVDPIGTFVRAYNFLRPGGIMIMDGIIRSQREILSILKKTGEPFLFNPVRSLHMGDGQFILKRTKANFLQLPIEYLPISGSTTFTDVGIHEAVYKKFSAEDNEIPEGDEAELKFLSLTKRIIFFGNDPTFLNELRSNNHIEPNISLFACQSEEARQLLPIRLELLTKGIPTKLDGSRIIEGGYRGMYKLEKTAVSLTTPRVYGG